MMIQSLFSRVFRTILHALNFVPNPFKFFLRYHRFRVDLLSYESKTADKQELYNWRAEKYLEVT